MTNNVFTQSEESLWKRMPSGLKSLLLTSNEEIKLDKLLTFYNTSNFRDISTKKYTPKYSFVLANYYVHQMNNIQAACNLIFNANFILYLNKSTTHTTIGAAIDYFLDRAQFVHATHLSSAVQTFNHTNWKEIDSEDTLYEITSHNEFPTLYTAYQITAKCSNSRKDEQRLNKLREYTTKAIENDYNQLVTKRNEVVDHLMGSGDWWKSDNNNDHHRGKKKKKSSSGPEKSAPPQDKEEIVIKFVDEQSQEQQEEVSIKITKSTQLKIPFNQYAEGRRLSLRSFRFVYGGNTLFVSSVGKQTPIDLGMEDGDVITVINLEAGKEEGVDVEKKPVVAKAAVKQKKSSSKKRTKGKQKKKRASQPLVIQHTEVELKVEHSKLLGRVHEEAESQFKLIRQHLNNLVLERSKPKSKKKKKHKEPLQSISQVVNTPSSIGLGGKAGKTHYTIQVGEVSNLYKTSKRRRSRSPPTNGQQQKTLKIDLHGLTRQESLKSLDDSLPIWQERAMSGSYPFVVPVEIVCGGGSQVLSEVVEQWIRNNDQVANAPKTRCC